MAVDLHSPALEGFFTFPLEHLTAVQALAEALPCDGEDLVVVAPDLGAARLGDRYARAVGAPVAMVHKTRVSGEEVLARAITGEVRDRTPMIVDDMISTGATVEAAVAALREAGSRPEIMVVATHLLLVGRAAERLAALGVTQLVGTDTVASPPGPCLPLRIVSVAPMLAEAVACLHEQRSLADLLVHG